MNSSRWNGGINARTSRLPSGEGAGVSRDYETSAEWYLGRYSAALAAGQIDDAQTLAPLQAEE
jgi:hypothetical protein